MRNVVGAAPENKLPGMFVETHDDVADRSLAAECIPGFVVFELRVVRAKASGAGCGPGQVGKLKAAVRGWSDPAERLRDFRAGKHLVVNLHFVEQAFDGIQGGKVETDRVLG